MTTEVGAQKQMSWKIATENTSRQGYQELIHYSAIYVSTYFLNITQIAT